MSCLVCALQSLKFLNMHNDPVDVPSIGDAKPLEEPGPHAERQKEENKPKEEEWEEWEEWGDEGERRCYLLGQEHDSREVQEREAGERPI